MHKCIPVPCQPSCFYCGMHVVMYYVTMSPSLPGTLYQLCYTCCDVLLLLLVWTGTTSTEISLVEEVHHCHATGEPLRMFVCV